MSNGSNDWNVSFSRIAWVDRALRGHANIASVDRSRDIYFTVARKKQADSFGILCLDEYVMGVSRLYMALDEFPDTSFVILAGGWCKYTAEAKAHVLSKKIGLFNTHEFPGALWLDDYWAFHSRDEKGNPRYYYGTE